MGPALHSCKYTRQWTVHGCQGIAPASLAAGDDWGDARLLCLHGGFLLGDWVGGGWRLSGWLVIPPNSDSGASVALVRLHNRAIGRIRLGGGRGCQARVGVEGRPSSETCGGGGGGFHNPMHRSVGLLSSLGSHIAMVVLPSACRAWGLPVPY